MKKIMLIVGALALTTAAIAQDKKTYKTKFGGEGKRVVLYIGAKSVSVEGYDGDEVIIEAENVPQIPKEAEGLRPVGTGGLDNTQIGLSVNVIDNALNISTVLKGEATYKLRIPRELGLQTKSKNATYWGEESPLRVQGLSGNIDIMTIQDNIELIDVTGPIVANSNRGKIKVVFNEKMSDKPSSFAAHGDNIDISVPETAAILFSVAAREGNFFTDLELKPYTAPKKEELRKGNVIEPAKGTVVIGGFAMKTDLAQMQADVAQKNTQLSDKYLRGWYSSDDQTPQYVLNEPKTFIKIMTTSGNIYLRKSNGQNKK